jgi:3-hydroxyacyl-CoA dehydrogenase
MPIDEIRKICFVGSGTMGCFNSLVSAIAGYDVVLYDISEETVKSVSHRQQMLGMAMIRRWEMAEKKLEAGLALPFTRILYARRLSTFKFESLTHNLQEGISTPHDLMAWWWITLPVKVAPNPGN